MEQAGWQVVAADLSAPEQPGTGSLCVVLDVTDSAAWAATVARILDTYGRIDGLANVAGVVARGGLDEMTDEEWDRVIAVNQIGTFYGIRAVAGPMRAAGRGSIVNISSIAGMTGFAGSIAYVTSKWAVRGLTRAAALEFGDQGIRVNSVHPGSVDTSMTRRMGPRQPINRYAAPQEIAELVHFLASDASSYCTGSEFVADGGALAGIYR